MIGRCKQCNKMTAQRDVYTGEMVCYDARCYKGSEEKRMVKLELKEATAVYFCCPDDLLEKVDSLTGLKECFLDEASTIPIRVNLTREGVILCALHSYLALFTKENR